MDRCDPARRWAQLPAGFAPFGPLLGSRSPPRRERRSLPFDKSRASHPRETFDDPRIAYLHREAGLPAGDDQELQHHLARDSGRHYGKLEGYWSTEIGPLNQVMHLWSYTDLNERARLRAELAKNQRWTQEYMPLNKASSCARTSGC